MCPLKDKALHDLPEHDTTAKWNAMKGAVYKKAMSTFGKEERPSQDWFNAHLTRMEQLIEEKKKSVIEYEKCPNLWTHAALTSVQINIQRIARQCANGYWQQLCEGNQCSDEAGNTKCMYSGIKKALGPTVNGVAPKKYMMGEKITYRGKQMGSTTQSYTPVKRWSLKQPSVA